MKTNPWRWFGAGLLGLLLAVASPSFSRADDLAAPVISEVRLEGAEVVVVAEVPPGIRKVTLEARAAALGGTWVPRAVARLEAPGGTVTFRIAGSGLMALLRVRADTQEVLPSFFYRGTNTFAGQAASPGNIMTDARNPDGTPGVVTVPTTIALPMGPSAGETTPIPVLGVPIPSTDPAQSQPRNVVESDIWQLAGDTLYFFNQYRGLQVIDVGQPDTPVLRGTLPLPAAGEQMYVLDASHVILLARGDSDPATGKQQSQVVVVEITNGQPRALARLPLEGSIQESRLVGTALYVASLTYQPDPLTQGQVWQAGTRVAAFDLSQPANPVAKPIVWLAGGSYGNNVVTATDQYLFVATMENWTRGTIHCVDISAPDGTLVPRATVQPAGLVRDKFKMNLSGDIFTVVSEQQATSTSGLSTVLETFSLADPAAPQRLGSLQLGNGERLYATRFDGNRVFVVTFRRIDPLWIVDLSNPAQPSIRGELQVPGWSTYIQPLGDRLVAVGLEATNGQRVAVSLFDVHDLTQPALLSRIPLGANNSWSEANADEKALSVLPDAGLILIPVSTYSTNQQHGVQLIDLGSNSLTLRGFIGQDVPTRRATLHRDRVLAVSGQELLTVDATDRDHPVVRAELELAFAVNQVFAQGDYLVELANGTANRGNSYYWGGLGVLNDPAPILRVAPSTNADYVLGHTVLTNLPVVGATVQSQRLYVAQGQSSGVSWSLDPTSQHWLATTNPGTFLLSILDLAQLPQINLLGQTSVTLSNVSFASSLQALWPKPGLLVWWAGTTGFSRYWDDFYTLGPLIPAPIGPTITVLNPDGSILIGSPPVRPISYPYWLVTTTSRLLALDVQNPVSPTFLSNFDPGITNQVGNLSPAFAGDGLAYWSHQALEHQILGTNYQVFTNQVLTPVTNLVIVTNITRVLHSGTVTNLMLVTNVTQIPQYTTLTNLEVQTNYAYRVVNHFSASAPPLAFSQSPLVAGDGHNLFLQGDGSAVAWGGNWLGQLGDGTTVSRPDPAPLAGLDGLRAVTCGQSHSLALKADGSVWAWGLGSSGQLGLQAPAPDPNLPPMPPGDSYLPALVAGLTGGQEIAAGDAHSVALKADGTVWAWGGNWYGQLGLTGMDGTNHPVLVPGVGGIAHIAAGANHTLAISTNSLVWAWGDNAHGQAAAHGQATTPPQAVPTAPPHLVASLNNIVSVSGGGEHSLALAGDGTAWAWGSNEGGQLGSAALTDQPAAAPVAGLHDVAAIAAGQAHSLALRKDGTVLAWGLNDQGQLGDGTLQSRNQPTLIPDLTSVMAIAAGRRHSLALRSNGEVWAWGDPQSGALGSGTLTVFTNYVTLTNLVTQTNYLTVTNEVMVTNTFGTNWFTYVTNLTQVPKVSYLTNYAIGTNAWPIVQSYWRSYLDVVDYADAAQPTLRPPVNLPGVLQGIGYDGALLYTLGFHAATNGANDPFPWLEASAYDGVNVSLVDSLAVPGNGPVLALGTNVLVGWLDNATNAIPRLETWTLSEAGKFTLLGRLILDNPAANLASFGNTLAVQTQNSNYKLLDATNPATLKVLGAGRQPSRLWSSLNGAAADPAHGLWLPLGDYGAWLIPPDSP